MFISVNKFFNHPYYCFHYFLNDFFLSVRKAEYAVRGVVPGKADEYQKALKEGVKLPFKKLIRCNIGNPQSLEQVPISYLRRVLAVVNCPELLKHPNLFPADVMRRSDLYLKNIPGGVGAYSHSQGVEYIRKEVSNFITTRDGGIESNPNNIYLTDGASSAIKSILSIIISKPSDGIMIPIPQYPLYTASIALYNATPVSYYLNEENGWSLELKELERSYNEAKKKGIEIKAITIINPGNPTGQTLTENNMKEIIDFCNKKHILILADEVYQENIWNKNKPFHSFKKIANSMGKEISDNLELASFHSTSKGFFGECGHRGGYMELMNFDPKVLEQIYKIASISLCSNLDGQVAMGVMVNPPKKGEESFESYNKEKNDILSSLRRRAVKLQQSLNGVEGIKCQPIEGALYAFPTIEIPPKAVKEAKRKNQQADVFYCLELLNQTGLVVVPGSGFGQVDGTFHFRTTILPPEREMDEVNEGIKRFHTEFMRKYK